MSSDRAKHELDYARPGARHKRLWPEWVYQIYVTVGVVVILFLVAVLIVFLERAVPFLR